MERDKLAFERKEDYKGFNIKAWYLLPPNNREALVQIYKDGELHREFTFPAYKIWNIAAHFTDIVDGEINGNTSGYELASCNLLTPQSPSHE